MAKLKEQLSIAEETIEWPGGTRDELIQLLRSRNKLWHETLAPENVYKIMAPGEGQAFRQPGSVQCMQPSLRINHSSLPFSSVSAKRITVQLSAVKSIGLSYTPWLIPISSRKSFHSEQAT